MNKPLEKYPDVLSVRDIQTILDIGRRQAYELIHSEQFFSVKVGKSIKISKKVFVAWLNGETQRETA